MACQCPPPPSSTAFLASCELLQTALRSRFVVSCYACNADALTLLPRPLLRRRPRELQRLMPSVLLSTRSLMHSLLGDPSCSSTSVDGRMHRTSPLWTNTAQLGAVYTILATENTVRELTSPRPNFRPSWMEV